MGTCSLVPGEFGWFVQLLLATLSFSILLIKYRYFEKCHRPFNVFACDLGKQVTGACWLHMLNLITATILFKTFTMNAAHPLTADPCDWYFLNIMLDTTFGMGINFCLLRLSEIVFGYVTGRYTEDTFICIDQTIKILENSCSNHNSFLNPPSSILERIQNGLYQIAQYIKRRVCAVFHHHLFLRQVGIWLLVVSLMKMMIISVIIISHASLPEKAHAILNPLRHHEHWKLLFVMIVVPLSMNTMQYWLTDQFIKENKTELSKRYSVQCSEENQEHTHLSNIMSQSLYIREQNQFCQAVTLSHEDERRKTDEIHSLLPYSEETPDRKTSMTLYQTDKIKNSPRRVDTTTSSDNERSNSEETTSDFNASLPLLHTGY